MKQSIMPHPAVRERKDHPGQPLCAYYSTAYPVSASKKRTALLKTYSGAAFAKASGCIIELEEKKIPVSETVKGVCGILGIDPLYMGNEGKMTLIVEPQDAEKALRVIKNSEFGQSAAIIGQVRKGDSAVTMRTELGGVRMVDILYGEGLPRIC